MDSTGANYGARSKAKPKIKKLYPENFFYIFWIKHFRLLYSLPSEFSKPKRNIKNYLNFLKIFLLLGHSPSQTLRKNKKNNNKFCKGK